MKAKKEEFIYRIYNNNTEKYIGSYDKNHWVNKKSALTRLTSLTKGLNNIHQFELHTFEISLKCSEPAETALAEFLEEKRLKEKKSLDERIKRNTAIREITRLVPGDLYTIALSFKKGCYTPEIAAQLEPHFKTLNTLTPIRWA